MAHHIYQTEGYILGRSPMGEANAFFRIYTKDLGLVHATAQGVRYLKSKLRYSLQEFSYSDIALVRGKEMWRITNARERENIFYKLREREHVLALSLRVLSLIERFVQGEEKNDDLFNDVTTALTFFEASDIQESDMQNVEYIFTLKILSRLGYGPESKNLDHFVESPWSMDLIKEMATKKTEAKDHIDRSIRESHL